MTDVFILGAGFSIAVASPMPSAMELGRRVIDQQKSIHAAAPRVHSSVCDGLSCDDPVLPPQFPNLDFEHWLSKLAEPQPYLFVPQNLQRRAMFEKLSGLVAMQIDGAVHSAISGQPNPPPWLVNLISAWNQRRATVVSFNYDTIIEATVDHMRLRTVAGDPVHHQNLAPMPFPMWAATYDGPPSHADSLTLIKLHGSTNWYWDDVSRSADSVVQVGLRSRWGEQSPVFVSGRDRAHGKVPFIAPPTSGKSEYSSNSLLRDLWRRAYEALVGARRVFVIGYSLPVTDQLVRSLLEDSLAPETELWVINPDLGVVQNFEALRSGKIVTTHCGGSPGTRLAAEFVDHYVSTP